MTIQGAAPESCRTPRCGYLIENVVTIGGRTEPDHRCAHEIPMHSACPWFRTPEQIQAMHERDQAMASAARQPMQKRGL